MNTNEILHRIQTILLNLYWGEPVKLSTEDRQMWLEQIRIDVTDDERREDYFDLPTFKDILDQIREAIEDETN